MSTRRPSYSTSSSTGSFSAAQWGPSSYGSSYPTSPGAYSSAYPSASAAPGQGSMINQSSPLYAEMGMQPSSGGVPLPGDAYYASTPRSALGGGSAPPRGPSSVDPYSGYSSVSEPIAISRPSPSSYPHHQSQHPYITTSSPTSHSPVFHAGTSPQSPSSPHSPVSQLSQFAYVPASPQRPFACDMCALSFSRQHDLKRHRDTHSGEKPFFCNGGCGKQFTRKDALKRHQLVKRCGTEDN